MHSRHTKPTIEFLDFKGCPNTPALRASLQKVSLDVEIIEVDLMSLKKGDHRLGWGAPTILVNGKDLFGLKASDGGSVSCRNWSHGLPSSTDIAQAMKEFE